MSVETRIYVMKDSDTPDFDWLADENFEETLEFIEGRGNVYTLDGFIEAFNNQEVSTFTDTIFKLEIE